VRTRSWKGTGSAVPLFVDSFRALALVYAIFQGKMGFASASELGFVSGHDFSRAINELKEIGL